MTAAEPFASRWKRRARTIPLMLAVTVVGARRAERLLGLRLDVDPASTAALTPGPVIVLCRHVNLVDASLATLLYQRLGYRSRGVIMAELLADPDFDLIYTRTGSVFIPRDNGPETIAMIRELGRNADPTTAVVIFPEGRLFRPDRLKRSQARLALENTERAERLASLTHVLPPRPGGVLTLLDTIPADVVVIAHSGLDQYPSFTELAKAVPLREPIRVILDKLVQSGATNHLVPHFVVAAPIVLAPSWEQLFPIPSTLVSRIFGYGPEASCGSPPRIALSRTIVLRI